MSNQKEILDILKGINGVTERLIENQKIMATQLNILAAQIKIMRGEKLSSEEIEKLDLNFK